MPTRDADREEMLWHTKRATALLRECQATHDAEGVGLINSAEAMLVLTDLMRRATEHTEKALALKERLRAT